MQRVENAKSAALSIGIMAGEGTKTHTGSPGLTVLEIATFHEFGMGVPERSFIRGWFDAFKDQAQKYISTMMQSVIAGKRTKAQALQLLGVRFVGECQKYLITAPFVPLAPATIRRKGSSIPLVDTGQLKSSITFRIDT
jgi:hypothetical protein